MAAKASANGNAGKLRFFKSLTSKNPADTPEEQDAGMSASASKKTGQANAANALPESAPKKAAEEKPMAALSGSRDDKILGLLDILGQRMLETEGERQEFRDKLSQLDYKANNNEEAFIALQNQMLESRKSADALSNSQKNIEIKLNAQIGKIDKAFDMAEKIEEALTQQARLNRRIDKIMQDKARMIGKLERIEETVIETQEALSVRSLRIVSEHKSDAGIFNGLYDETNRDGYDEDEIAAMRRGDIPGPFARARMQGDQPANEDLSGFDDDEKGNTETPKFRMPFSLKEEEETGRDVQDNNRAHFWQNRSLPANIGGVTAMVALAVFCGWGVSQIPFSQLAARYGNNFTTSSAVVASADTTTNTDKSGTTNVAANVPTVDEYEAASASAAAAPSSTPTSDGQNIAQAGTAAADNAAAVEPAAGQNNANNIAPSSDKTAETAKTAETKTAANSDIYSQYSDKDLLEQFQKDPDALAAKMNQIEPGPGATPSEDIANAGTNAAQNEAIAANTAKASLPAAAPVAREDSVADFIKANTPTTPLADRIKPDPNLPELVKAIEKKAFQGIPEAQHDLAAIYTAGHGGVQPNFEKAAAWFREAAVHGIANARYNLGVLYHQGLGVKKNLNTAMEWYRAAAALGHPEAQYNLGIASIEGIGAPYDPQKAATYFRNAADAGILEAAYNLGLIYENGLLGNADPQEALAWYKLAANLGSPEAKTALDQLAKVMEIDPNKVEAHAISKQPATQKESAVRSMPASSSATKAAAASRGSTSATTKSTPTEMQAGALRPADMAMSNEELASNMPKIPAGALSGGNQNNTATNAKTNENFKTKAALIAQIQEQLMRVGLYPGPADGRDGPMTDDAIRSYQSMYDLPQTGKPSDALLIHMLAGELDTSIKPAAGSDHLDQLSPPEYGSRAE